MGVLAVQNILKEKECFSMPEVLFELFFSDPVMMDDVTWLYWDEVVITFSTRDRMSFNRIELDWIENPWCSQLK